MSVRSWAVAALAMLLSLGITPSARAGFQQPDLCASTTNCTLGFNLANTSFGLSPRSNSFGTLDLHFVGTNTVKITVDLADGFRIIDTGFPGAFGFGDSLGGGLNISHFTTGGTVNHNDGTTTSLYSGKKSDTTNDLHFDGFGYTNDTAATTAPKAGPSHGGLNSVSFLVSKNTLTDVEQLLRLFNPVGGDGAAVFVVDAWVGGGNYGCGNADSGCTGLLAVAIPEPGSLALLSAALIILFVVRRRQGV